MKRQERIERFEMLISVLEKAPEENFDLSTWGVGCHCGTTCCALGWAAVDPEMSKRLGIVMVGLVAASSDRHLKPVPVSKFSDMEEIDRKNIGSTYTNFDLRRVGEIDSEPSGFDIGAEAFGVSSFISEILFEESNYRQWLEDEGVRRNHVIARIKALIELFKGRKEEEEIIPPLENAEKIWMENREEEILAEMEKENV